jgi:uncharacterized protein YceH (UPF0502 family)
MHPPLTHVEVRVLGALLEKAATTPEHYPLTLSALVAACNQLSNREPVMQLDEEAVSTAVVTLRRRSLLRAIQPAGSRVTKYQHLLHEALDLEARELALLGVLMLRGPQTAGELNTRTARWATFEGIADVERQLDALLARDSGSLVARLPRRPGQKEQRYAQLLGGAMPEVDGDCVADVHSTTAVARVPAAAGQEVTQLAELEGRVGQLEAELAELRAAFTAFRAQF